LFSNGERLKTDEQKKESRIANPAAKLVPAELASSEKAQAADDYQIRHRWGK
jgi:hypothetical protein